MELLGAVRIDWHNRVEDVVVSPRAALVFDSVGTAPWSSDAHLKSRGGALIDKSPLPSQHRIRSSLKTNHPQGGPEIVSRAFAAVRRRLRRIIERFRIFNDPLEQLRSSWERKYQWDLTRFTWHDEEVPRQLVEVLEEGRLPDGPALDLGCGPGVTTARIVRIRPTVGLDISRNALGHAASRARDLGVRPLWVVGATPLLPFPNSTFGFVFERGTMQQLPAALRREHLREVARVLRAGGLLQFMGRAEAGRQLEGLCPPTLRIETLETIPPVERDGITVEMVHALLRRVR